VKVRAFFLGLIVLAGSSLPAVAAERISFAPPILGSNAPGFAATVRELVDRAVELMVRLYPQSFTVDTDGKTSGVDYSASTIASQDGDTLSLVLGLKRVSDGFSPPPLAWSASNTAETPLWLARATALLWSSSHGFPAGQATTAPVYVDELPVAELSPYGVPLSLAITPAGNVAVALSITCVELDHTFRQVGEPGGSLAQRSTPIYVGGVQTTPGGSFLMKPSTGRDLYRLQPGAVEPLRMPTGIELSTIFYWAAYPDGSALLIDAMNRKALRIASGNKRQEVPLFATASSWPSAYAIGPEGSIWVYDPQLRGLRIFTGEGKPVDIVLPLVDTGTAIAATALAVGPDGSFLMYANKVLMKFSRNGELVWTLNDLPGSSQTDMPSAASLAVDWARGLIYLSDITGKRVVKLLDRAWCRQNGVRNDFEESVLALRVGKDSEDVELLAAEARLYAAAGSTVMGRVYWERIQDVDPSNVEATAQLASIELQDLKNAAKALDTKARALMSSIGIETARGTYLQAMQKYELILSKAPSDAQARADKEALQGLFSDTGRTGNQQMPLSVDNLRLANLFPALMQWYESHPAGSLTVQNPLPNAVDKVRVTFFIPQFMDLPVESKSMPRLAAGESARFDISPAFNQKILELQEDMATQFQVTVYWSVNGIEQSVVKTGSTTIYRNSALTWDDTRKIGAFITPNEQTISTFAARVLAAGGKDAVAFSPRLFQAMRICDALSIYGLTYVPDPDSPISKALGSSVMIDTVRFPRTTLYNRTGDCDDTTALLCSLMESAGIRTAVLTSPGHIFMAFDTGEPAQNAGSLSDATHEVIKSDGEAWIPIETTILSQGFMAAWASASALVHATVTGLEFIPVAGMRDTYPALPLAASVVAVAEPSAAGVDKAHGTSMATFTTTFYSDRLKALETRRVSLSGRPAALTEVQEGILQAVFGKPQQAESSFKAALSTEPNLVSPYVNLANLRLLSSDEPGALAIIGQGLARNADAALLNLLAARIYAGEGNADKSRLFMAAVKRTDPSLAARYTDLLSQPALAASGSGNGGSQRASSADESLSVIWTADQ